MTNAQKARMDVSWWHELPANEELLIVGNIHGLPDGEYCGKQGSTRTRRAVARRFGWGRNIVFVSRARIT
jgi:hypothetical protein